MGHAGGMLYQCANVTQRNRQLTQTRSTHQTAGGRHVADVKRHDPAISFHLPAGDFMLRVTWQSRIVHALNGWMTIEETGDLKCIVIVSLHPQCKRLDTAMRQTGGVRRNRSSQQLGGFPPHLFHQL